MWRPYMTLLFHRCYKTLNNLLDYLGGVPLSVKSDSMRQWVSKSCKYVPTFPSMLEQWAGHKYIALLAARPYKPRDKPSVENGVVIAYRRIYAQLRNESFYSLAQLNKAIKEKLALHHQVNFRKKRSADSSYSMLRKSRCCNPCLPQLIIFVITPKPKSRRTTI
jgi:hypothetical protein